MNAFHFSICGYVYCTKFLFGNCIWLTIDCLRLRIPLRQSFVRLPFDLHFCFTSNDACSSFAQHNQHYSSAKAYFIEIESFSQRIYSYFFLSFRRLFTNSLDTQWNSTPFICSINDFTSIFRIRVIQSHIFPRMTHNDK